MPGPRRCAINQSSDLPQVELHPADVGGRAPCLPEMAPLAPPSAHTANR